MTSTGTFKSIIVEIVLHLVKMFSQLRHSNEI